MSKFTHLHTHSHFSLLNALPKIPELVAAAKEDKASALALTDDGVMYGCRKFYAECVKQGIKPIVGVDFYVALRGRSDKQARVDNVRYRLVLLAKNKKGYINLMKLVTTSFIEGFYYKPRIDRELLEKYSGDLVAIIPQFSGETSQALRFNNEEKAQEAYDFYKKIFGKDLYLEIVHHPEMEDQVELQKKIIDFSEKQKAQLVATSDSYYLKPADKQARDVLADISNPGGAGFSNTREGGGDFSLRTEKEMLDNFSVYPEAIANTKKIEKKCDLELDFGQWHFPALEEVEGKTYDERLRDWAYAGFEKKEFADRQQAKKRLDYELEVITKKGFSAYFLIVADFLRYAREKRILANIRGSVAGSVTTYVTGVTHLDPFEYKIPFERFLNPERPSAPDIDMDFASDGRDEMLDYARDKYGHEKVAQIGTFGTMAARSSVKDATRTLGFPYQLGDQISKLIPMGRQGATMYISTALEQEAALKKLYEREKDVREIIDMAQKIEGSARHISVHAAGVVIAPDDLTLYTPLQIDPKGNDLITQYDMHDVGEDGAGLIKFDFLGVNILTTISETLRRIYKIHGEEIDIQEIPMDDKKTYRMLSAGFTQGCFQLASEGMTRWLKELKPRQIQDINAMVALYRPGAMAFIPDYITRKNNPKLINYKDSRMKDFLEDSLGLMIYQDDVMMIAIELAGYSWLEADKFRKAMGKKIPKLMAEQEKKFKEGAVKNGMDRQMVDKLWEEIKVFAQYGFNKAHAASYGRVAYQTAWLKANYPAEYMSALLTTNSGDTDKVSSFVEECHKMKIPVLQPDINLSFKDFGVLKKKTEANKTDRDQIRFGLRTIKNLGEGISENIVEERKENGLYKNFEDFLVRNATHKDLSKKSLEALALSGALDSLVDRNAVLANITALLDFIKDSRDSDQAQDSLFADMGDQQQSHLNLQDFTGQHVRLKTGMNSELEYTLPMKENEKLFWEKELLGLYISAHPLDSRREKIEKSGRSIARMKKSQLKRTYQIYGVIDELRIISTKKGKQMAFSKVSDTTDSIDVVIFPDVYQKYAEQLSSNRIYSLQGTLEKREGAFSFLLEKIKELSS